MFRSAAITLSVTLLFLILSSGRSVAFVFFGSVPLEQEIAEDDVDYELYQYLKLYENVQDIVEDTFKKEYLNRSKYDNASEFEKFYSDFLLEYKKKRMNSARQFGRVIRTQGIEQYYSLNRKGSKEPSDQERLVLDIIQNIQQCKRQYQNLRNTLELAHDSVVKKIEVDRSAYNRAVYEAITKDRCSAGLSRAARTLQDLRRERGRVREVRDIEEKQAKQAELMQVVQKDPILAAYLFNNHVSFFDKLYHSHPNFGKIDKLKEEEFLDWFNLAFAEHRGYSTDIINSRLELHRKFGSDTKFRSLTQSCAALPLTYDMLETTHFDKKKDAFTFTVQLYRSSNDSRKACEESVPNTLQMLSEDVLSLLK